MKARLLLPFASLLLLFVSSCQKHKLDTQEKLVPLTVDENEALPSIAINGTLLHAQEFGNPDSTMLVMLHGGPGADYRSLLKNKAFANDGYYVVFYDQRGSGLSKRHNPEAFTTQMFIDDLHAVIDYYKTSPEQKVVLVGQSWGAMLATGYVNQYPNEIAGLILTEPGGFTWSDTKDYVNRAQQLELFAEGTNDYVYLDQFFTAKDHRALDYKSALGTAADTHVGNADFTPFWRKGAICSSASFEYVQENSFDFTTNLKAFGPKVLFGYSELNGAYGRKHALLVSSAFSDVKLIEFKNTGHSIPYFGWEQYHAEALTYLNDIL